jgi:pyruvate-formate lyase-activating enzyme
MQCFLPSRENPSKHSNISSSACHFLCEYCHSPEFLSTAPLTIDHLTPQSLGGADDIENLALACRRCNERRYNFTTGIDPETQKESLLFHPRQQIWAEHFIWTADKLRILGLSALGRATCERLDINDDRRADKFIQKSRQFWVRGGWHPPKDDPCLEGEK